MTRHPWLPGEIALLRRMYPDTPTERIAALMRRSLPSVYRQARREGLRKTDVFLRIHGGRLSNDGRGIDTRFRPGHEPWNKGTHYDVGGRSVETRFKPGRPPQESWRYKPIGSLRVTKDNILQRKVTDDQSINSARRWVPVARLVWEAAHGPIPRGHVVRFREDQHTTVEAEITIDRLECISKRDNLLRNSYHTTHPPELRQIIQLTGALTRKIRNREKHHEQQNHQ